MRCSEGPRSKVYNGGVEVVTHATSHGTYGNLMLCRLA